jgi:hypothetical protein
LSSSAGFLLGLLFNIISSSEISGPSNKYNPERGLYSSYTNSFWHNTYLYYEALGCSHGRNFQIVHLQPEVDELLAGEGYTTSILTALQ